jgi:hypothetical protein
MTLKFLLYGVWEEQSQNLPALGGPVSPGI